MQCTSALHLFINTKEREDAKYQRILSIGVLRDMEITVKTGIIAVMILACIGAASASNLIQNGGFEAPVVTNGAGWYIYPDGYSGLEWDIKWADPVTAAAALAFDPSLTLANAELQNQEAIPSIDAHTGDQYAELDTDWDGPGGLNGEMANVTISQTLQTSIGQTCHILYYQSCREADDCTVKVDWAGTPVDQTGGPIGSWVSHTFDVTASAPTTTISFTDMGVSDSIGVLIDDVSVECDPINPPPVPEFPTIALPAALIVGMLGAVLFIQRYKEN